MRNYVFYCIALTIILFVVSCRSQRYLLNIDSISPDKQYRVYLTEIHSKVSEQDPWPYKVLMKLEKKRELLLQNEILDHYDDGDIGLGQFVKNSEWVSNNVLWLGDGSIQNKQKYDWIEVSNNSNNTLSYASIPRRSGPCEVFLIFELKPQEKVKLKVIAETDEGKDYTWVSFLGKFKGQKSSSFGNGKNFKIKGVYKSPSHYYITVNDNNVEIKSQEYDPVN